MEAGQVFAGDAEAARPAQRAATVEIPVCTRSLGTIAIVEPDSQWWRELNLASPEAILRVFVQKSGCFTLVNRGRGLQSSAMERGLADNGEPQKGSNVGKGQIKAADYFLQPDIVSTSHNAGGGGIGGVMGGLIGHGVGAVAGGLNVKKREANVTLSIVNSRTTVEEALTEGYARKSDISFGGEGSGFFGSTFGSVGGGYQNTEIGRLIVLAYLDAYAKLVMQLEAEPDSRGFSLSRKSAASPRGRPAGDAAGAGTGDVVDWGRASAAPYFPGGLSARESALLPWPPYQPSEMAEVTKNFPAGRNIGAVSESVENKLKSKGYSKFRYFLVPDGIALMTQVERMDDNGFSGGSARFITDRQVAPSGFTEFFRNLLFGEDGRFRMLLFIISTSQPVPQPESVKQIDLDRWSQTGVPFLSDQTARESAEQRLRVWLLVYEFECNKSRNRALVAVNPDEGYFIDKHLKFLGMRP